MLITAKEFFSKNVYNDNKVYGLFGYPLKHSMSHEIHKLFFDLKDSEEEYYLIEISKDEINQYYSNFKEYLAGFNCTIPHKETIIPYLDDMDERAKWYGAVNTVKNDKGKLIGFNTDGPGFLEALKNMNVSIDNKRVLVIGSGGVARVMVHEAANLGSEVFIYSVMKEQCLKLCEDVRKNISDANVRCIELSGFEEKIDVILNCSPVGMWPDIREMPIPEVLIKKAKAVFDAVYNPLSTKLILTAKTYGINAQGGLSMLVYQAAKAQEIWKNVTFNNHEVNEVVKKIAWRVPKNSPINIVFTGFMGSGKTRIGREVAKALNLEFVDLDEVISNETGMSIDEIFKTQGEDYFRSLESKALERSLSEGSKVVATGGGALTFDRNIEIVKNSRSLVVFLKASVEEILKRVGNGEGRPLLESKESLEKRVKDLYEKRMFFYEKASDLVINADQEADAVKAKILECLGLIL